MSTTAGCTNTDKRHFPLRIERMPDGGFVVSDTSFMGGGDHRLCVALFASSSIGEALAFVCSRLDPETHKAWQDQQAKASHDAKMARIRRGAPVSPADEKSRGCGAIVGGGHEEASRGFAKGREGSEGYPWCATCGADPRPDRCNTCGRGVGVSELTKARPIGSGDWAGA